ncbi:MAG: glycosyltransferase family 4 protein [Pseudomonadota bacterium]
MPRSAGRLAVVVKGYPRLSETFIAQEILGLQNRGIEQLIVSLRHPYDDAIHDMHRAIRAEVLYLPEYLKDDPTRVRRARAAARALPGHDRARAIFESDLARDGSANRLRRWGQACVLASELPEDVGWLHSHYLHTPASVTRYAAALLERPWSFSAHAKDIWTTPEWELREKLRDAAWGVSCTRLNTDHLNGLADGRDPVSLVYHGLDLATLDRPEKHAPPRARPKPFRIVTVGRAVEKKGFDDLLRALSLLPDDIDWHLDHIGKGELLGELKAMADGLGLSDRVNWKGSLPRSAVFEAYRASDLFVLSAKIARSGDRDGLPNVLMEAQLSGLACIATRVSAIPELIDHKSTGWLVEPGDPGGLAAAITQLARDDDLRMRLAEAGTARVRSEFSCDAGIDRLAGWFRPLIAS